VLISQVKTWVTYGWIDHCNRNLNMSRILEIEKLPDPGRIKKIWNRSRVGI